MIKTQYRENILNYLGEPSVIKGPDKREAGVSESEKETMETEVREEGDLKILCFSS